MSTLTQFFSGGGSGPATSVPVNVLVVTGGFGASCHWYRSTPITTCCVYAFNAGNGGFVLSTNTSVTKGCSIPITVGSGGVSRGCPYIVPRPSQCCGYILGGVGGSSCFGSCVFVDTSAGLICCQPPSPYSLSFCYKYSYGIGGNAPPKLSVFKCPNTFIQTTNRSNSTKLSNVLSTRCDGHLPITLAQCSCLNNQYFIVDNNITSPQPYYTSYPTQITFAVGGVLKNKSDSLTDAQYFYYCGGVSSPDYDSGLLSSNCTNATPYGTLIGCGCPTFPTLVRTELVAKSPATQGFITEMLGTLSRFGMTGSGYMAPTGSYFFCNPTPYTVNTFAPTIGCFASCLACSSIFTNATTPIHTCVGHGSGSPALIGPEGGSASADQGTVIVQYPNAFSAATVSSPNVCNCSPQTPGCFTYRFLCPGTITIP